MTYPPFIIALASSAATDAPPMGDTGPNPVTVVREAFHGNLDLLTHPEPLAQVVAQIHIVWAAIFILVGAACILNGYRWHKSVVIVMAAMSGVWAGNVLGPSVGDVTVAAVCMSVLFAVLAWPLLRYAVALFGGLAGAFAGANVWTAVDLSADQHRVGALIGLVVVGMLAFMAFRAVVIVMTAIGGASLLVFGGLAALSHVAAWHDGILAGLQNNKLLVPVIAASTAVIGGVIQFSGGFKGMATLAEKADPANAKKKAA